MRGASDSRLLRLLNGQRILDAMFDAAPQGISRAAIARLTGLSKPTVSNLVADLETSGLIRMAQMSIEVPNIGRPAMPYEIVPEAGFVVAADVGASKIIVGIANLLGAVVAEEEIETGPNAQAALERLAESASQMLAAIGGQAGAACVGIPGVYRPDSDRVEQALNLGGFDSLTVRATLETLLGTSVQVANDVNLAAVAESDAAADLTDFAAISVGTGIGMGLIIGGELYRGGTGAAGEIGSIILQGAQAEPNAETIVESVASAPAIRRQFVRAFEDGFATDLSPDAKVAEILAAASRNDAAASHVLGVAAEAMATVVMQVCLVIDPERIVFGGGVGSNQAFVAAVADELGERQSPPVKIVPSTLGRRATFLGAVSTALGALHESLITTNLEMQP